jgi:hypothetical protein
MAIQATAGNSMTSSDRRLLTRKTSVDDILAIIPELSGELDGEPKLEVFRDFLKRKTRNFRIEKGVQNLAELAIAA